MYKVFFLESTDEAFFYFRRFPKFDSKESLDFHHDITVFIERRILTNKDAVRDCPSDLRDDPRWPSVCKCGYEFKPDDVKQLFHRRAYRNTLNGEYITIEDAPIGACYDATWDKRKGPDGRSLVLKTPGGHWYIDSRASNCDMRDEHTHRCWTRKGSPEEGTLHVDKAGFTCGAGAGSIIMGSFHGFCHNGLLYPT